MSDQDGVTDFRLLDAVSGFPPDAINQTDFDLIQSAKQGDASAYASLYRRHFGAMLAFAWHYSSSKEYAEDLAAESFANFLNAVREGKGPNLAVRAYLLTVVRNTASKWARRENRVVTTDDVAVLDHEVLDLDPVETDFENSVIAKAFASLPERWQKVLWYIDVEGATPAMVAPALGLRPNTVSTLAKRAREGLRKAYLREHALSNASEACKPFVMKMAAYSQGGLGKVQRAKVSAHLDGCEACAARYAEIRTITDRIGMAVPLKIGAVGGFGVVLSLVLKDSLLSQTVVSSVAAASTGGAVTATSTAGVVGAGGTAGSSGASGGAGGAGGSSVGTIATVAAVSVGIVGAIGAAAFVISQQGGDQQEQHLSLPNDTTTVEVPEATVDNSEVTEPDPLIPPTIDEIAAPPLPLEEPDVAAEPNPVRDPQSTPTPKPEPDPVPSREPKEQPVDDAKPVERTPVQERPPEPIQETPEVSVPPAPEEPPTVIEPEQPPVVPETSLSPALQVSATSATLQMGQVGAVAFTVTNSNQEIAKDVRYTLDISAVEALVNQQYINTVIASSGGVCEYESSVLSCVIGDLPPGASATPQFPVAISSGSLSSSETFILPGAVFAEDTETQYFDYLLTVS